MEIHPHYGIPSTPDETVPEIVTDYPNKRAEERMRIVGLGGSGGSLAPLVTFFKSVQPELGAAYVVVTHRPESCSADLCSVLQQSTPMPVVEVQQAITLEANHVYVIAPGTQLSVLEGVLQPTELSRPRGKHVTIDLFFRSLADAHGPVAVAIILSGGDGDGSMGFKRVKERGGLTIVQDPHEAEIDGMPRTAIATGMVDWILPSYEMAAKLAEFHENGRRIQLPTDAPFEWGIPSDAPIADEATLADILTLLRSKTGYDFFCYKRATVLRRVGRRMQVQGRETLRSYFELLENHPAETRNLLQDLLISVTNFFRDKEAFGALAQVIPDLFRNKSGKDSVRVWVAGCATGEEAYSVAILLLEHAATLADPPSIQVFATDLNQLALDVAREGKYADTVVADLTEDRLRRFFTLEGGEYRVEKFVRDAVVFAIHNVLSDPPYSNLELVSCRNLLIYFKREAHGRVFDAFHFGLRPSGKLFLGPSESADESRFQFKAIDRGFRLYRRIESARELSKPAPKLIDRPVLSPPSHKRLAVASEDWSGVMLKLVERISAPSILIHRNEEMIYLSHSAGRYLHRKGGEFSNRIVPAVHPDLAGPLRAALDRVSTHETAVRTGPILVDVDGENEKIEMIVQSAEDLAPDLRLVTILTAEMNRLNPLAEFKVVDVDAVRQLGEELERVRNEWRLAVSQHHATHQELRDSNEELRAMNEELRSATQNLEIGREELQSINEEIFSVNQELKSKVSELSRANGDLQNLMASTNIATIFLDRGLRIKRFTPSSTGLFNFIPSDIGRPFSDVTHRLDYPEITEDSEQVIRNLTRLEREVRDDQGRWFVARMFPYRSDNDQIAGVVITCVDITERKRNEETREWLSTIVESSNDAIISFTLKGDIVSWNKGAEQIFGYTAAEVVGRPQSILAPPEYQSEKQEILDKLKLGEVIEQVETVRLRKDGQLIDVSLSAAVLRNEDGTIIGATIIAQDVSIRKRALEELKQTRDELEERVRERTAELETRAAQLARLAAELTSTEQRERKRMAQVLHDHLQQILVAAKMRIESLAIEKSPLPAGELESLAALLQEALVNCRSLVFDLSPPVLAETLGQSLLWLCSVWMKQKYDLDVTTSIDPELDTELEDVKISIFQCVRELLFNVVKHSDVKEASVDLRISDSDTLVVIIRDRGVGFDPRVAPDKVINSGFGLSSLRERLEMVGGSLELQSKINGGVTAIITAPISGNQPKFL